MARTNIKDLTNDIMLHTAFEKASKSQVEDVLRTIFSTITDRVVAGDSVHIPGFGKFECFQSSVTGRKKPKFSGAKAFKEAVNA